MFNILINTLKLSTLILGVFFAVNAHSAPELKEGFDWGLPAYAEASKNGGMLGEVYPTDPEVPGAVLFVLWKQSEPTQGEFDFSRLDASLNALEVKGRPSALIRLEVNSKCHAPDWVTAEHSSTQSFKFWQDEYREQLRGFVAEFAKRYKDHTQIVGVHLGIADGEYKGACPVVPEGSTADDEYGQLVYGGGRDGWGEFNWSATVAKNEQAIYEGDGLTPYNFKRSVKKIIDMYLKAFGKKNAGKLVWMGFAPFGSPEYRDSIDSIYRYVKRKKLGNREGQIEAWMRYTGNIHGVDLVSELAPDVSNDDGSCSMTFNERFADQIQGRYWGDENEFYGDVDFITKEVGPAHNQPYRFYMSSMRALQLRKNYLSIYQPGHEYLRSLEDKYEHEYTPSLLGADDPALQTKFNSASFITYLSKTLGKTRADTPDAFVVLGEKTIRTNTPLLYPTEYANNIKAEPCLDQANSLGHVLVSDFGRWLSVVSKTEADPTMRKDMPDSEKKWGQIMSKNRSGVSYELYARKAKEMHIDINNKLMWERCRGTCNLQVKVVFKDDHAVDLQVFPRNGADSEVVTTEGDGKTRTATFDLVDFAGGGRNSPDFHIASSDPDYELSVLMVRVNFVDEIFKLDAPTIISPKDDEETKKKRVVLTWAPVQGAQKYMVSYDNAGRERSSRYIKAKNLCRTGVCKYVVRNLRPGVSNWKVRSKSTSAESDWSMSSSFVVR